MQSVLFRRVGLERIPENPVAAKLEPLESYRMTQAALDNVVSTPHPGYVAREDLEAMFGTIFDQIRTYEKGAPINVVNSEVLERRRS